jgi:hypothetical protein
LGIGSVGGELGFGYLVRGGTAGGSVRHLVAPGNKNSPPNEMEISGEPAFL